MRRRVFLNRPSQNSVAAIYAVCEKDQVDLILSDCNKTVSFDVGGYASEDRENTLYKVDTMIEVLTEFRDAITKRFAKIDKKGRT